MRNSITENIFDSIDIIIKNEMEKTKNPDTIRICTIIRKNKTDPNKYLVSYGSVVFEAKIEDITKSYSQNDKVYVRIPQGDYSFEKIITGIVPPAEIMITPDNNFKAGDNDHGFQTNFDFSDAKGTILTNQKNNNTITALCDDISNPMKMPAENNYYDYIAVDYKPNTSISGYNGSYILKIEFIKEMVAVEDIIIHTITINSQKDLLGNPNMIKDNLQPLFLFPCPKSLAGIIYPAYREAAFNNIKITFYQDNKFDKSNEPITLNEVRIIFGYNKTKESENI